MTSKLPWIAAASVALVRLAFLAHTGFIFDDALITARYGAMMAAGYGPVFNPGVPSWGFTSPVWMLVSAFLSMTPVPVDVGLTLLNVGIDATLAFLVTRYLLAHGFVGSHAWAGVLGFTSLFALLPVLNRTSVGGMESSLFALTAFVWWTSRSSRLAALAPFIRPEGLILTFFHYFRERASGLAMAAFLPAAVGWLAAGAYFGTAAPLSMLAKEAVYGGFTLAKAGALLTTLFPLPFLPVVPRLMGESSGLMVVVTFSVVAAFLLAKTPLERSLRSLTGLAFALLAFFIVGGALACEWYVAPIMALLIVSATLNGFFSGRVLAVVTAVFALYIGVLGFSTGKEDARLHKRILVESADFVQATGARSMMAEAVGVPGFRTSGIVLDEIGIVTPEVLAVRDGTDGWYVRALRRLEPDALVVRPALLHKNLPNGGTARPFADAAQVAWFNEHYVPVADFVHEGRYTVSGWTQVWLRRSFRDSLVVKLKKEAK